MNYFESTQAKNFDVWKEEKMSFWGTIYPDPGQDKVAKNTNGQKQAFLTKTLVSGTIILV